jgi:methylmalonyl-CoA mutase N-terminal domain/subunit
MFDQDKLAEVNKEKEAWEKTTLQKTLDRFGERRAKFVSTSSAPVERLYTPADITDFDYERDLGFPGQYPFTRGVHPTMYRGRLWTMRMFAGFGTAGETNPRYKYLLEHGETGLSVAFDFPTLYGYDTDAPEAEGEFGKCGVAVSSLADMDILFDGIPVDEITTSMTINGPAAVIWAMYIVSAEKRGIPMEKLGGTIQNDILKEYIAQKSWLLPPRPSMRLIVDTFEFGTQYLPKWNTISISGYHIREAGATAVQELAFTLADGFEYVKAGIERGLDVGRGRVCSTPLFLLQRPQRLFRGNRQVPGGAAHLGARDERALWGQEPSLLVAALPHSDGWLFPQRPATGEQHCAHRHTGFGGRPRRDPESTHQLHG